MSNFNDVSSADKDACLPVIDLIVKCAGVARKEGVLALEEFAVNQDNEFLTFAMLLVVDGIDPQLVKGILETLINADNHTGRARLERIIIAEGVLSVQAGENPRLIEMKLLCCLGEDYLRAKGHFPCSSPELSHNNKERLRQMLDKDALQDSFNNAMLPLSDRDIQEVFREVDQRELCIALKGCSEEIATKLLENVSPRLAATIIDDMELHATKADIWEAQKKITDIANRVRP